MNLCIVVSCTYTCYGTVLFRSLEDPVCPAFSEVWTSPPVRCILRRRDRGSVRFKAFKAGVYGVVVLNLVTYCVIGGLLVWNSWVVWVAVRDIADTIYNFAHQKRASWSFMIPSKTRGIPLFLLSDGWITGHFRKIPWNPRISWPCNWQRRQNWALRCMLLSLDQAESDHGITW